MPLHLRTLCSLGLAAYIYSLDGTTTYFYLNFATSSFGEHSLISPIQVAQSIISQLSHKVSSIILTIVITFPVACGKPVVAKVADVSSRGTAYAGVCKFISSCTLTNS